MLITIKMIWICMMKNIQTAIYPLLSNWDKIKIIIIVMITSMIMTMTIIMIMIIMIMTKMMICLIITIIIEIRLNIKEEWVNVITFITLKFIKSLKSMVLKFHIPFMITIHTSLNLFLIPKLFTLMD